MGKQKHTFSQRSENFIRHQIREDGYMPLAKERVKGQLPARVNQVSIPVKLEGVNPDWKSKDDHNLGVERAIFLQLLHTRPSSNGGYDTFRLGLLGRLQQKISAMTSAGMH